MLKILIQNTWFFTNKVSLYTFNLTILCTLTLYYEYIMYGLPTISSHCTSILLYSLWSYHNTPLKTYMASWENHRLNQEESPIKKGDFPTNHVGFQGFMYLNLVRWISEPSNHTLKKKCSYAGDFPAMLDFWRIFFSFGTSMACCSKAALSSFTPEAIGERNHSAVWVANRNLLRKSWDSKTRFI